MHGPPQFSVHPGKGPSSVRGGVADDVCGENMSGRGEQPRELAEDFVCTVETLQRDRGRANGGTRTPGPPPSSSLGAGPAPSVATPASSPPGPEPKGDCRRA